MIDQANPDYDNSPASDLRPLRRYAPSSQREPLVSIITPYFNTGPIFWDTFRSLQRMSLPYWEWLIVDDGSTDSASLAQLQQAADQEPRIRVLRRANGGPAVARNHAACAARGRYFLILDSDDMVEPTFAEKALWFLATQSQSFAAVNAYNVTFGAKNLLWPRGFQQGAVNLRENEITNQSVVRADAWRQVGGFDERVSYEHADWDFWLNLAEAGLWGYTLPEYLTWYRTQERSLVTEITSDANRDLRFRRWLAEKHHGLDRHFPRPRPRAAGWIPDASHYDNARAPFTNPLDKPDGVRRLLLIAPWLEVGGADQLNLDLVRELSVAGWECTVVATLRDEHPWLARFSAITPDVFCLPHFLHLADHPRFLSYLIDSRQIDAVLVSNSAFGYAILPYLRARHPRVALLDYTHAEEPEEGNDGYPGESVAAGNLLDRRLTGTHHLRSWLLAHGANPDTLDVRRCAIDTERWRPDTALRAEARAALGIAGDTPVIVFVGRMAPVKRPRLFAEILALVARQVGTFAAFAVGGGEELGRLRRAVRRLRLEDRLTLLGQLPADATRQVMRAADILIQPSAMEGLSVVLIEAMALGVVPVVADVGGQGELVTPEVGYLIPRNAEELTTYAHAVLQLLASSERRAAMAVAARARVEQAFSMTAFVSGMEESLDRAIAHARLRAATADPAAAAELARTAVARLTPDDVIDARWAARNQHAVFNTLRLARQIVIPEGTARYAAYKGFREQLRELTATHEQATQRG